MADRDHIAEKKLPANSCNGTRELIAQVVEMAHTNKTADAPGHAFINRANAGAASKQAKIQMGSPKRNTLCITNTHINNHTDNPSRTVRVALSTCGGPEPLAH